MKMNYRSKYFNRKCVVDGVVFDSQKEANRFAELSLLERAGTIQNLQRQVKYTLIPSQKDGKGRNLERPVTYIADFVYQEGGKTVVEDAKGVRTKDYIIKRKLMLFRHGIRIKEV